MRTAKGVFALGWLALLANCGSSSGSDVTSSTSSSAGGHGGDATGSGSTATGGATASGPTTTGQGTTATGAGGSMGAGTDTGPSTGSVGAGGGVGQGTGGAATGGTSTGGAGGDATGGAGGKGIDAGSLDGAPHPVLDAAARDSGVPVSDPEISGAVGAVNAGRISSGIDTLAGFTTRNTCANNTSTGNALGAARDWVKAQLQGIAGLKVSTDDFMYTGCASGTVTDQNVVAVKLGTHPDRVFVIGGHYDSRTINGTDPTSPAPGANDSGSQTAAVIEIARAMAPLKFDATLIFAAFAAEEQGFHGSAQLVKDYPMFVTPTAKVEAMVDLDIVGGDNVANNAMTLQEYRIFSPGTPREFNIPMGVTDDTSPSRGLMRYIGYWGSVYVPSMTMLPELREDRPGRGSDHESFINAGIPGVRFIETNESPNAATMASHQHSPNDLPMYVTPAYTARIAQIVVASTGTLARAPMPPEMASATGPASGPWMLTWSAPSAGPAPDHYVVAARATTENFYHTHVVASGTSHSVTAAELGLAAGASFFVSVASVDAAGHESLFAYPEYRCDAAGCAVQPGSLDVTARN